MTSETGGSRQVSGDDLVFPMSFGQERLWFLHRLQPVSTFSNLSLVLPFDTAVNAAVLDRCLNDIVRRHESLRTVFDVVDAAPVQIIRPAMAVPLEVVDLRAMAGNDQSAEVTRLTVEFVARPFDLAHGPLLRCGLLRLGPAQSVFMLAMHHIVSDGWSLGVLWRELMTNYESVYLNRPSPLPELPIQYADFAVWQRDQLKGERLEELLGYWRRQLADLPTMRMPTDHPRPSVMSYRGALHEISLPRGLVGSLRALSRKEGVTPFMTLFAAFAAVLRFHSGQEDIAVGLPSAGRGLEELEGLIGFFVNSLVLRADLTGNPSFRELLGRVRKVTIEALEHQDMPFEKLVEELRPERDLSSNPLFQVSFQLFSGSGPQQGGTATVTRPIAVDRGAAVFDLAVNLWEAGDAIGGQIEYSTDLFERATIERLAGHFGTFLKDACARPDATLAELRMLTDAELRRLLGDWNDTAAPVPPGCVHELVARQAAATPDALAVSYGDEAVNYATLEDRAAALARRLRSAGAGRGSLVAICLDRGVDLVVAMLAVLKAGAAYVPLDPAYPPERLGFMLDDSGARIVLSESRIAEGLPESVALKMLLDVTDVTDEMVDPGAGEETTPEDVAYVIYTSGSTGAPKGVVVPHRGLANLVAWHRAAFGVTAEDRASQVASAAFDACGWEIWPYLASGASVHVVPDAVRASPTKTLQALAEARITIAFLPTPLAQLVLETLGSAKLTLRYLLIGGDKLTQPVPAGCSFEVVNNYGPTEYSVVATSCLLRPGQMPPPIGRPIANTQAHVLDAGFNLVPVGSPGELYLGGEGLALGYHGRPDLTAERFVEHPVAGVPGGRLYRTGDLVRRREDGTLDYLGRTDSQVKLRGFRIELGDIESAVAGHPDVSEAVVLATGKDGRNDRILAFVVGRRGAPLPVNGARVDAFEKLAGSLRAHLRARLPGYMVPDIVVLDELPQTANGKIDRSRLTAPEMLSRTGTARYVAPGTPLETFLVGLWQDVLDLERVGANDNFFEIGGHSLLATSLVSRLRELLKVDVPLQLLFQFPTPAEFAVGLRAEIPDQAKLDRVTELASMLATLSEEEVKQMLARPEANAIGKGGQR